EDEIFLSFIATKQNFNSLDDNFNPNSSIDDVIQSEIHCVENGEYAVEKMIIDDDEHATQGQDQNFSFSTTTINDTQGAAEEEHNDAFASVRDQLQPQNNDSSQEDSPLTSNWGDFFDVKLEDLPHMRPGAMDNDDDTSDTELDDFDPFKEYRLFNEPKPLARGLNISLENSLILHLSFAKRHNLTKAALQDLLHLTNLHLVQPNDFPLTLDKLYSGIGLSTIGVSKKYYCKNCFELLCENDDQCPSCNFVGKDFFIYNSIEEQLKRQLQKTRFKENLIDPRTRDSNSTVIKDVYDGKFYKDLIKDGYFENDGINLTCQLNTDGVSLFRSSTFSVWPVYLRINELPPLLRKSKEFKILPGLWFGKKKPYMRTFLRPIVDAMKNLCRGFWDPWIFYPWGTTTSEYHMEFPL
uniref:Uncharacterized protein n=1 Tax=Clytia hemisphaerica TaxID=252671 RepID=A0A7M5WME9_9CNID